MPKKSHPIVESVLLNLNGIKMAFEKRAYGLFFIMFSDVLKRKSHFIVESVLLNERESRN